MHRASTLAVLGVATMAAAFLFAAQYSLADPDQQKYAEIEHGRYQTLTQRGFNRN